MAKRSNESHVWTSCLNVLMMANVLHVRFVGINNNYCPVEAVQHLCAPQWLKWSCDAGGLTWRSQVGANPIPIPHPTNLALFGHKITLYRFNQGLILLQGLKSEQGTEPLAPLTLTTGAPKTLAFTAPVSVQCTDTNSEFIQTNKRLYKRHWS